MGAKNEHRERVLRGFGRALMKRGYAATTVSDIAAEASTSKRTFYEHFRDKDDCFHAFYSRATDGMLAALLGAMDATQPVPEQLRAMIRVYLRQLQETPAITRAFFMETQAGGRRLIALRREVLERFAETLLEMARTLGVPRQGPGGFSQLKAVALVSGINELVMMRVEKDRVASLPDLEDTAVELLCQVLGASARASRAREKSRRS